MLLLLRILFPGEVERPTWALVGRALLLVGLIAWSWRYFSVRVIDLGEDPGLMHGVHLVFHEAGHAITAMLSDNRTAVVFMGSGLQVLFPLAVAGAFYFGNKDGFGAAVMVWWAGHAALDVAPYINDARMLSLQLLGGGTGREIEGHDWEYLLEHWGVLHRDIFIAAQVATWARFTMALAFVWGGAALLFEFYLKASPSHDEDESGGEAANAR